MLKENKTTRRRVVDPALQIDAVMAGARRSSNSKPNEFPGSATDEIPLTSDASFTQICGCRVFRTLRHFSHILESAHVAYIFLINWRFRQQFQYSAFFYLKQYSL